MPVHGGFPRSPIPNRRKTLDLKSCLTLKLIRSKMCPAALWLRINICPSTLICLLSGSPNRTDQLLEEWIESVFSFLFKHQDIIHVLQNPLFGSMQLSSFDYVHKVVQPSPLPNYRNFLSPPQENSIPVNSHSPFLFPQLPPAPDTVNLFFSSMDLPLLGIKYKRNHVIHWLLCLSLSIMFLGFIHVVA